MEGTQLGAELGSRVGAKVVGVKALVAGKVVGKARKCAMGGCKMTGVSLDATGCVRASSGALVHFGPRAPSSRPSWPDSVH